MPRSRSRVTPRFTKPPPEEILAQKYEAERLEEMGAFTLRAAVTKHLAAAYPDATASLLSDLRDVNLSSHNLIRVILRIASKGRISSTKPNEDRTDMVSTDMKELGKQYWAGMVSFALQYAAFKFEEGNLDLHYLWENYKEHMEPMIGPEDLEEQRLAAKVFEAEMKSVTKPVHPFIERVPSKRVL